MMVWNRIVLHEVQLIGMVQIELMWNEVRMEEEDIAEGYRYVLKYGYDLICRTC